MSKTFDISVKFSKLSFDDYIEFENRKVQLTHYDGDGKTPLFLQFIDGVAQPVYCMGFKNAAFWLKTGILNHPTIKTKTSKAKLDGKQLIVTTWKNANDGTDFSINYDGQDLECWEFERIVFPQLSDLERSHLMLFSPWFTNVFAPARYNGSWEEAQKYSFPSTFDVLHWNLAKHMVERIAIARKVLSDQSV